MALTHSRLIDSFREKLRAKLRQLGITQTEAAEKIHMNRGAFSALLNGHDNPTLATIEKIAEGLEIDISIQID